MNEDYIISGVTDTVRCLWSCIIAVYNTMAALVLLEDIANREFRLERL